MASAKFRVHCRRCLRGPALFLALWAVLLCSAPALATDQTNPAGAAITANPGMAATADGDRLTNNGIIKATTTGSNAAVGMGDPTFPASFANLKLLNSGTITASATGVTASITGASVYAEAYAYGMFGGTNSTLANSGTITASATGGTVSVTGANADVDISTYGMHGADHSTLANSGTIAVSATGGTASATDFSAGASAFASGMEGGDNSTLTNSGTITASATGGTASATSAGAIVNASANAFGMSGGANSTLANSGTIAASAAGNNGKAWGMYANGDHSTLANSGTITAGATDGVALGMWSLANSTLTNSGAIRVSATDATGKTYGMSLYSGTVANYGLVSAIAANPANAWELYGQFNNPARTVRITNWATDLRDFTTYKFFGSDGIKLDLDGSRLTLRPGAPERGFAWGREYAVSDLAGGLGQGAVASVTQEVPWARAQLTGTDWTDQKLSLQPNFTRKTNIGQGVTSQGIALILDQARGLEGRIDGQRSQNSGTAPVAVADSGPAAFPTASGPDSGWSGFLTPYFSYVDNSDLDYDAKIAGFMAGATRRFSDAFAAGVHLGFSHADVSADLADQDGEALTGLFGLHAIYNATPEWYLRGQLTGFISRASNDWESGLPVYPLYTDADINSRGLYASLATGYDWRVNASNTITPEIGLSWLWSHQDSFSLNWKDRFGNRMDNYDLDYKAQDYNALYGTAMLRWRGEFALAGGSFQPALGVGVRQTLTDGDVKSRLTTAGSSFSTKATEDETTALAEAGFVWQRGITSVGLAYTGGYGGDQVVHTGWLTLKLEF